MTGSDPHADVAKLAQAVVQLTEVLNSVLDRLAKIESYLEERRAVTAKLTGESGRFVG